MDLFTAPFWTALLSIVIIDLVLAGDNAIVIGLAARKLPKSQQKKVILWGTFGAVFIRTLATIAVVWLLKIPGLLVAGGLVLIWIAYNLLAEQKSDEDFKPADHIWGAIRTVIIADAVMGLDNVIAVAGAADGHIVLVVIGLLISVPIVVWGSTMIVRIIERHPWLIYLGGGVLAYTAGKMIATEKLFQPFLNAYPIVKWCIIAIVVVIVLVAGYAKNAKVKARSHP